VKIIAYICCYNIKDIGNQTIDLSKVERVGNIYGDPSWLRYTVYFTGA
jgi:hypothetical protein